MKNLDQNAYKNYITAAKSKVRSIEHEMETLEYWKKIASLSYEDWCKWQNKELEL